uniref:CARD domain-containing protein n=1 Tax=Sinocyclocheilus grahami TaxID=75366 RepID=A0A672PWZ9_SINGR
VNKNQGKKDLKIQKYVEFVDTHYEALLQRVTSVMPITDKLYESKKLTWEAYSKITKATSKKTQMRELLNAVKSGGPAVKSAFYEVLQEIEPDVIQELEGKARLGKQIKKAIYLNLMHFQL